MIGEFMQKMTGLSKDNYQKNSEKTDDFQFSYAKNMLIDPEDGPLDILCDPTD
jgi:hypothetical protein